MAESSSAGGTSLPSQPLAPARSAASTCSSPPKLVRMMTFGTGSRARSRGSAATPPPPGSTRSRSTTSGPSSSTTATASSTSAASPTTSSPSRDPRKDRRPFAHDGVVVHDHQPDQVVVARAHAGTRARTVVPTPRVDSMSSRPPSCGGALAHRHQAQPSGADGPGVGIEALAVVGHLEHHLVVDAVEADHHLRRHGVANGVGHGLLGDAEQGLLGVGVEAGHVARLEARADAVGAPDHVEVLGQAGRQPFEGQRRRPQLEDERAQLGEDLVEQAARSSGVPGLEPEPQRRGTG